MSINQAVSKEGIDVKYLLSIERSANEALAVKYLLSIKQSANKALAVKYLLSIERSANEALAVKYFQLSTVNSSLNMPSGSRQFRLSSIE